MLLTPRVTNCVNSMCAYMLSLFSHVWRFATVWTVACQAPLSMGSSTDTPEYWSELPFPPRGDLPNSGIKPAPPTSSALGSRGSQAGPITARIKDTDSHHGGMQVRWENCYANTFWLNLEQGGKAAPRRSKQVVLYKSVQRSCLVSKLCLTLCHPMDCSIVAHQAPLSTGFPKQEYWSGLLLPPSGALPDPGIKPMSPGSPASAGGFFTTVPLGRYWLSTEKSSNGKRCSGISLCIHTTSLCVHITSLYTYITTPCVHITSGESRRGDSVKSYKIIIKWFDLKRGGEKFQGADTNHSGLEAIDQWSVPFKEKNCLLIVVETPLATYSSLLFLFIHFY